MALHSLSLCSGIGGLDLGLKLACGARTVGYVEHDAYAAACLVARMEEKVMDEAPIWDNIESFDGKQWCGVVDIITTGFPCQPFSRAGKQRGTKDKRWLWPSINRIIKEIEPNIIFIENVPAILDHGFRTCWNDLRTMGYDVEGGLFSAEEIGAPHLRQRFFALAYRTGSGLLRTLQLENCCCIQQGRCTIDIDTKNQDVADSNGKPSGEQDDAQRTEPRSNTWSRAQRSGRDVGHTNQQGLEEGITENADKLYSFPPGPDSQDWKKEDKRFFPAVESDVRRTTNGPSYGVVRPVSTRKDRLRCLGNAVVPLQSAYAFSTLASIAKQSIIDAEASMQRGL